MPMKKTFLNDSADLVSMGAKSINSDSFTKCFSSISALEMHHSGILYIFSLFIRYLILFPIRFIFFTIGTILFAFMFLIGILMKSERIFAFSFLFYCNVFCLSFGARIRNHGVKRRLDVPHVYVANHTSFLDFIVLSSHKFCHAGLSEDHGGLFGFFFKKILRQNGSLYFKRCEKNDKIIVKQKLIRHIKDKKTPMLVFPEGTCVNNKYTVLFQKSVFEIDTVVCPVAIKYKRTLFDPYWNRRRHTFTEHLFYLMSRWMIDVDVYWMEPVTRQNDESVFDYVDRVKNSISERAGLVSLKWNGYMKNRVIIKDIEILRAAFKQTYLNFISIRTLAKNKKKATYDDHSTNCSNCEKEEVAHDQTVDNGEYNVTHLNNNAINKHPRSNIQKKTSRARRELYVCENPELIYFSTVNYDTFIKSVLDKYSLIKYNGYDVKCDFDNFMVKPTKVRCSCNNKKIFKRMKFVTGLCRKEAN